jgi:hypothetical protein
VLRRILLARQGRGRREMRRIGSGEQRALFELRRFQCLLLGDLAKIFILDGCFQDVA